MRRISFVNRAGRNLIMRNRGWLKNAERHWPVSGVIRLRHKNLTFDYYAEGDDHVANSFYYKGFYEPVEMNIFLNSAKKARTVFDIGANTGIYACLAALVNPSARVFAFEPNPVNFGRLEKNIRINHFKNVTPLPVALGNEHKIVSFAIPSSNIVSYTSSVNIEFSRATHKNEIRWITRDVEQICLDEMLAQEDLPPVDLVKIDVEGYEIPVLQGAQELIARYRPLILCEVFFNEENTRFISSFLSANNYFLYTVLNEGVLLNPSQIRPYQVRNNFLLLPGICREFMDYKTLFAEIDKQPLARQHSNA